MIDGDGLVTATTTAETITVRVAVAETDTYAGEELTAELVIASFVDFDGDGLIDIHSLAMLHNMRHNLAGTSYKGSGSAMGIMTGCPDATPGDDVTSEDCIGYELMSDLDFDINGDGTWTESSGTYVLDNNDNVSPYFVVSEGGWEPIGMRANPLGPPLRATALSFATWRSAVTRNTSASLGSPATQPFATSAWSRSWPTTPVARRRNSIAPLVGYMEGGTLTACYATGTVNGGDGK